MTNDLNKYEAEGSMITPAAIGWPGVAYYVGVHSIFIPHIVKPPQDRHFSKLWLLPKTVKNAGKAIITRDVFNLTNLSFQYADLGVTWRKLPQGQILFQ